MWERRFSLIGFLLYITCVGTQQITPQNGTTTSFYSESCTADTYSPNFQSPSSIMALISFLLVIVSTVLILLYMCFMKFATAMVN